MGGNRLSSFFVYVSVSRDISGGGTRFEGLDAPGYPGPHSDVHETAEGEEWCKWVNCDEPWENGVTFRPIARNAVFWVNLHGDGRGGERTLHAGLPVTSGTKLGMNIWTREGPLSKKFRGE